MPRAWLVLDRADAAPTADAWDGQAGRSRHQRELQARQRFTIMSREVNRRIAAGDIRPKARIWADVKAAFSDSANV